MKRPAVSNEQAEEGICTKCGLCCNGVIFADVKLRPAERLAVAEALHSSLGPSAPACGTAGPSSEAQPACAAGKTLVQPCAAFDGRLCRIYGQRPKYCRQFECALLKRVKAGDVSPASALSLVRSARKRAATVLRLLRQMGETDESAPLAARFRRVSEKAEKSGLQGKPAAVFGKLTNAIQGLNHLLARTFYPGE